MTNALHAGTRLVVASHNPGKVWEIRKLVGPYGLDVVSAGDLNLPEPEETEPTFAGNARLKALAAARGANLPALADDSGLEVECLDGQPGIYSARWAGPTRDFALAMKKVAAEVEAKGKWSPHAGLASAAAAGAAGSQTPGPRANFISVLCLAWPDGTTQEFEGKVYGRLVWPKRGANGFGYDPMFEPDGETETFGEMDPDRKNAMSHRARAFAAFVETCLAHLPRTTPATANATDTEAFAAAARSISSKEELVRFIASLSADTAKNGGADGPAVARALDRLGDTLTHAAFPDEPLWRSLARVLLGLR